MTGDRIEDAQVDWVGDAPRSIFFDDVYFSGDGPAEVRHVFLDGSGFHDLCAEGGTIRVGELGFGTGLNLLVAWEAFDRLAPIDARLDLFSIERHPLSASALERAHAARNAPRASFALAHFYLNLGMETEALRTLDELDYAPLTAPLCAVIRLNMRGDTAAVLALVLVGPAATFAGATLPIMLRIVSSRPGAVGRTSTYALTNVTLPWAKKLARSDATRAEGPVNLRKMPPLASEITSPSSAKPARLITTISSMRRVT